MASQNQPRSAGAIISVGSVHVLGRVLFRVFVRDGDLYDGVAMAIEKFSVGLSVSNKSAGGVVAGVIWNVVTGVVVAVGVSGGGMAVLIERVGSCRIDVIVIVIDGEIFTRS